MNVRIFIAVDRKLGAVGKGIFINKLDAVGQEQLAQLFTAKKCGCTYASDGRRYLDHLKLLTEGKSIVLYLQNAMGDIYYRKLDALAEGTLLDYSQRIRQGDASEPFAF